MKASVNVPLLQSKWSILFLSIESNKCKWERKPHTFEMHPTKIIVIECALGLSFGAAQIELNWIESKHSANRIESISYMISKLIHILLYLILCDCRSAARFASLFYWLSMVFLLLLFMLISLLVFFLFHSYSTILAAISLKQIEQK